MGKMIIRTGRVLSFVAQAMLFTVDVLIIVMFFVAIFGPVIADPPAHQQTARQTASASSLLVFELLARLTLLRTTMWGTESLIRRWRRVMASVGAHNPRGVK